MNRELIITLPAKVKKIIKGIKILSTVATVAMTVYTLIPKNEKIKNVNMDGYVQQSTRK